MGCWRSLPSPGWAEICVVNGLGPLVQRMNLVSADWNAACKP